MCRVRGQLSQAARERSKPPVAMHSLSLTCSPFPHFPHLPSPLRHNTPCLSSVYLHLSHGSLLFSFFIFRGILFCCSFILIFLILMYVYFFHQIFIFYFCFSVSSSFDSLVNSVASFHITFCRNSCCLFCRLFS